jgi:hypothetical protein
VDARAGRFRLDMPGNPEDMDREGDSMSREDKTLERELTKSDGHVANPRRTRVDGAPTDPGQQPEPRSDDDGARDGDGRSPDAEREPGRRD